MGAVVVGAAGVVGCFAPPDRLALTHRSLKEPSQVSKLQINFNYYFLFQSNKLIQSNIYTGTKINHHSITSCPITLIHTANEVALQLHAMHAHAVKRGKSK